MNYREGESKQVRYRSNRFFRVQQSWYVATREGRDIGPFLSRDGAERAAQDYVEGVSASSKPFSHGS